MPGRQIPQLFRSASLLAVLSVFLWSPPANAQLSDALERQGWRTDFESRTIDLAELSVNVPRDAIPSIDEPSYVPIDEARAWLEDQEPVLSITVENRARAYPLQILTWHEIVNDRLGGQPVAVTFCPLCYSALAFDRNVQGDVLDFGVSGMLRHSDLVMYDRQTHSLWQQLSGKAIVGNHVGTKLEQIPAQIISFKEFRRAYPDGDVLSRDTGYSRQYGRNPYPGYDDISDKPWLFDGKVDERLPPMERVVSVEVDGVTKAYPHSLTRRLHVVNDEVGRRAIVVFHSPGGATSALDRAEISQSERLGSTGVFSRFLNGRLLSFSFEDGRIVDDQTGSTWNIAGRAVAGSMEGAQLKAVAHGDIFSFAWFVIHPKSEVFGH